MKQKAMTVPESMGPHRVFLGVLLGLALGVGAVPQAATGAQQRPSASPGSNAAEIAWQRAATAFVANAGQWESECRFRADFGGLRCDVRSGGWSLSLPGDEHRGLAVTLRFRIDGPGEAAAPIGERLLPGRRNYFLGDDPTRWQTDVPAYEVSVLSAPFPSARMGA